MPLALEIDPFALDAFGVIAAKFGQQRFGYIVTPNVDHVIRYYDDAAFRRAYARAAYVLLDSRLLAYLLRVARGERLPVCPGSDLTALLFEQVIAPDDEIVLIGCPAEQAEAVRRKYGLRRLHHFDPPMGFIRDPQAVEACLQFVEAHAPFRYCFLAIGSPQQELVAEQLAARGVARGLALCIGASINFLTGGERRAPRWMQRAGLEWAFRLLQNPRRLARRYLVRGPRIFALLFRLRIVARRVQAGSAPAP